MKTSRRKFIKMSGATAILTGVTPSLRANALANGAQGVGNTGSVTELLEYIFTEAQRLPDINSQALALTELARLYGRVSRPRALQICDVAFKSAAQAAPNIATGLQSQVVRTLADLDIERAVSYLSRIQPDQTLSQRDELDQFNARSSAALHVALRLLESNVQRALKLATDQLREPSPPVASLAAFAQRLRRLENEEAVTFCKQVLQALNSRPTGLAKVYDLAHFLPAALLINKPTFLPAHNEFLRELEKLEKTKPHNVRVDIENLDGVRLSRDPRRFIGYLLVPRLDREIAGQWIKLEPTLAGIRSTTFSRAQSVESSGGISYSTMMFRGPRVKSRPDGDVIIVEASIESLADLKEVSGRLSFGTFADLAEALLRKMRQGKMEVSDVPAFDRPEQNIVMRALTMKDKARGDSALNALKDLEKRALQLPDDLSKKYCLLAIADGYAAFDKQRATQILELLFPSLIIGPTDLMLAERVIERLARCDLAKAKQTSLDVKEARCRIRLALRIARSQVEQQLVQQNITAQMEIE